MGFGNTGQIGGGGLAVGSDGSLAVVSEVIGGPYGEETDGVKLRIDYRNSTQLTNILEIYDTISSGAVAGIGPSGAFFGEMNATVGTDNVTIQSVEGVLSVKNSGINDAQIAKPLYINEASNDNTTVDVQITASNTGVVPLVLQGLNGQSANLISIQDYVANELTTVNSGGQLQSNSITAGALNSGQTNETKFTAYIDSGVQNQDVLVVMSANVGEIAAINCSGGFITVDGFYGPKANVGGINDSGGTGVLFLDSGYRQLLNSSGGTMVDFGTLGTVDFESNSLSNINALTDGTYESIEVGSRVLIAGDGITHAIDWSNGSLLSFMGGAATIDSAGGITTSGGFSGTFYGDGSNLSGIISTYSYALVDGGTVSAVTGYLRQLVAPDGMTASVDWNTPGQLAINCGAMLINSGGNIWTDGALGGSDMHASVIVNGGFNTVSARVTSYPGGTTPTLGLDEYIVMADATDSGITINLPPISTAVSKVYTIKNTTTGMNTVSVTADGMDTINNSGALPLTYSGVKSATIVANSQNNNWEILSSLGLL